MCYAVAQPPTAAALSQLRRVGNHAFDDRGCRFDRVDEAGGFAKPDGRVVGVAVGGGPQVARRLDGGMSFELRFLAVPPVDEGIALDAGGELLRPRQLTD